MLHFLHASGCVSSIEAGKGPLKSGSPRPSAIAIERIELRLRSKSVSICFYGWLISRVEHRVGTAFADDLVIAFVIYVWTGTTLLLILSAL